jgi:hypothetical protein
VVVALVAASGGPAAADLSARYRVTEAELMLFKQPQNPPFARMSLNLFVSGTKVRTETIDHLGRSHWFVADRETGLAWGMDPQSKTYWVEPVHLGCRDIPGRVASMLQHFLQMLAIDTLDVDAPERVKVGAQPARQVVLRFSGRVLGAPQPVATSATVRFPDDEESLLTTAGSRELYCGQRPAAAAWQRAFAQHLPLSTGQAGYLAGVAALPLDLSLQTDLGIGTARVRVALDELSNRALEDALFVPPADFTERAE